MALEPFRTAENQHIHGGPKYAFVVSIFTAVEGEARVNP